MLGQCYSLFSPAAIGTRQPFNSFPEAIPMPEWCNIPIALIDPNSEPLTALNSSQDECAILTDMEDFDIPAVEAAISRLREIQAEVFGADGHSFQMNPALPESEADSFERDHKIALPPD